MPDECKPTCFWLFLFPTLRGWRESGNHGAETAALESPWLLAGSDNPNDEQQDRGLQQPLLPGPGLGEDVDGDRDLGHHGYGMPHPQLVVLDAVGGHLVLAAEVDEEDRRPQDLEAAPVGVGRRLLVAVEKGGQRQGRS